ncbi:uncharacterized protein LOC129766230 [Toxorhynchites rutilus septentrionalis]|uniref:uncharacterized protein LOC129766230 n=1 Tax=Toxorhynchites rutilus septentrionalis TaxID=329112 RepID=UPI00247B1BB9|nr:uncharacterized protein LOC129766230 [Toxorhynchites rutilus septentrionalis]
MPNIRPLNPELAKKAKEELFEVPERLDDDIAALRTWLAKSPHIKSRTDDQFLVTYLRGCKHSLERAKEKLDMNYTMRSIMSDIMKNRDPFDEKTAAMMRRAGCLPLPFTETPASPRIVLIRPGVHDPAECTIQDIFKVNMIFSDIMFREDDNLVVAGQIGILDLTGMTVAHVLQMNPTFAKKTTTMMQDAAPLRMKAMHYINVSPVFETVFNLFKTFLNEKNRSRIYVHGSDMESLYKHVPKRLLPAEYGGEAGPIQDIADKWIEKAESYSDYFKEDDLYGTDESKRPGKPKTEESLFGIDGSFRKLEAITDKFRRYRYHEKITIFVSTIVNYALRHITPDSTIPEATDSSPSSFILRPPFKPFVRIPYALQQRGRFKTNSDQFRLIGSRQSFDNNMVNIRPVSDALRKKAHEELNEKPERIQEDLNALRQWIAKSPHIRARIDDQFLITFLRGCKYSLERTKEKIDLYYTVRTLSPELIRARDPENPKTRNIIRLGIAVPLPNTETPDSPRIILIRPAVYDPAEVSIEDLIRVSTMTTDVMMIEDDSFVISGQIGILDVSDVTMAHFLQFTPGYVKKMVMMSQDASPLRQKGFHYINTPNGFEIVFNMFKSFMSEKNKSRLYVHGHDFESLYRHVPQRLLPNEYGGEAGSLQDIISQWEQKLVSYRDYFLEEDQYGTDESKRPGKPKNAETLFGVDGSFRKLEVD